MLNRMLIGVVGSAGAALMGLPGIAMAQPPAPPPPPPPPNVNAYAPANLSEYQVMDNQWYAFKTPDGLTCVMQRNGGYGCSGPSPGAPEGASLVSGGPGVPSFATSANAIGRERSWPSALRVTSIAISNSLSRSCSLSNCCVVMMRWIRV